MSPETNDRSAQEIEDAMDEEAGRMQQRVDELGEHAQDAEKKAEVTREQGEPDNAGEPLGAVGGDSADEAGADGGPEVASEPAMGEDPEGAAEAAEDADGSDADDDRD